MTWVSLAVAGGGALVGALSSSGSPSGNTTTTTNNAPWGPQQTYLQQLFAQAQQRSNGGTTTDANGNVIPSPTAGTLAPSAYPGAWVAPQSGQTIGALDNLYKNGIVGGPGIVGGLNSAGAASGGAYLNSNPGNSAYSNLTSGGLGGSTLQNIANNGGYNPSSGYLSGVANNATYNPATASLNTLQGQATQNGAIGNLNAVGSQAGNNPAYGALSQFSGATNPYLDQMFNQGANAVQSRVQSQFAGNGRSNSGGETAALSDQYNQLATQIYGGAYEGNQGRALSAAQTEGGLYNQGTANQLNAYGTAGSLYNSGISNAGNIGANIGSLYSQGQGQGISAATDAGQLYNQGMSNAGSAAMGLNQAQTAGASGLSGNYNSALTNMTQNTALLPGLSQQYLNAQGTAANAGMTNDAYQQSLINAQMNQYNQNSNQPYTDLSRYAGLISGNYGGTQTTSQPYFTNTGANVLSGALGANQLYNQFVPQGGSAAGTAANNATYASLFGNGINTNLGSGSFK